MLSPTAKVVALAWQIIWLAGTEPAIAADNPLAMSHREAVTADAAAHEQSRGFFDNGVRLYQDGNLTGALAEFEAAYQIHPNSAAMQNIALCQKALFRYRDAKSSLELLLRRHEHELSPSDLKAARQVIAELATVIGTVKVTVTPATAKVSIDDRALTQSELAGSLDLDVGEHRLRIEAEGFEPVQRTLIIAGGASNPPLSVSLSPTHGYLTVLTPDEYTAIAIDGRAVAFESFRGYVEPGRHVIQIYRSGFEPYEAVVELEAGQSVTIRGKVGVELSESEAEEATLSQQPNSAPPRQIRGWYGLIDASVLNWNGAPQDIEPTNQPNLGYGYGLHAGYRLFTPIGVEAVAGATHHSVQGTCAAKASVSYCQTASAGNTINYKLDSRRVGGALRIMSRGESVRFTSSVGVGAIFHELNVAKRISGLDAYFALEAGTQLNIDHLLIEFVAFGWFDSASGIKSGQDMPYQEGNGIQMFGLSLRIGWSEWTPRDARAAPIH